METRTIYYSALKYKKTMNQEQFEAIQEDANKKRESFMDQLDEETKKQFDAVEQAVKILVDNKIYFYLFPYLPHDQCSENVIWQWNSLAAISPKDKFGDIDKSFIPVSHKIHANLLHTVYHTIIGLAGLSKSPFKESYEYFGKTLYESLGYVAGLYKKNDKNNES